MKHFASPLPSTITCSGNVGLLFIRRAESHAVRVGPSGSQNDALSPLSGCCA